MTHRRLMQMPAISLTIPAKSASRRKRAAASDLGVQIALPGANAINSIDRSTRQAGDPEWPWRTLRRCV
jgi:hypothetical protein